MQRRETPMTKVNFLLGNALIAWLTINIWSVVIPSDALGFETASRGRYPSPANRNEDGNVLVFDNDLLDRLFGKDRGGRGSNNVERPVGDVSVPRVFNGVNLPTVLPNRSLLAGISSNTTSRRAAALRFAERGRTLIQTKEYQKAISVLEKALNLDASPFIYYYLARAHYHLGNNQGSLSFLEVAESRLSAQPEWVDELAALRSAVSSAPQATQYAMSKQNVGLTYTEY
jgi:tetratricopeptide (TPR) repeat protein